MTLPRRFVTASQSPAVEPFDIPWVWIGRGTVIGLVLLEPLLAVAGLAAYSVRFVARWHRARSSRRRLIVDASAALPGTVALMQLAHASGCTPREIPGVLANYDTSPLNPQWTAATERLRLGAPFGPTLDEFFPASDPHLHRVAVVLDHADRDGGTLTSTLDRLAADVSRERMVALDVRAQRLAVQLLFPLVLCLLPAFVLLSMVPLALSLLSDLGR